MTADPKGLFLQIEGFQYHKPGLWAKEGFDPGSRGPEKPENSSRFGLGGDEELGIEGEANCENGYFRRQ
jgi:hypothetical protein